MNTISVWFAVVVLVAFVTLLLSWNIPLSRRREQGLRTVVIALSALVLIGIVTWCMNDAESIALLAVCAGLITYGMHQTPVQRFAQKLWGRYDRRVHRLVEKAVWLEAFSPADTLRRDTMLSSRSDLVSLLAESPLLRPAEKHMLQAALDYDTKRAGALMQPIDDVTTVKDNDVIGPLLLDELHRAHQAVFPVVNEAGVIAGTVPYESLMNASHHDVSIASLMHTQVVRVSPDDLIGDVLASLLRDGSWLAVVHSGSDTGIVTLNSIVRYLLGKQGR